MVPKDADILLSLCSINAIMVSSLQAIMKISQRVIKTARLISNQPEHSGYSHAN